MIDNAISKDSPIWLIIAIVAGIIYVVFSLCYAGIQYLKPYMDGIYKQHLKEHEGQKVKGWR